MNRILFLPLFLFFSMNYAQQLQTGNVIPEFGKTYPVDSPEFKTDTSSTLKVVFDVNRSFDPEAPNKLIETAARFLNMHEKAGVEVQNMKVALVLHGNAVLDVLRNKPYSERFEGQPENPNLPLLVALSRYGVRIILCGQSAAHYNVPRQNTSKHAEFALSAMTALVQLQNDQYRLINF